MEIDQANEAEAKRGVRSARNRSSLKKSEVIRQTEQIDSERLIKAIRYLQDHPKR
jgi:hypothetical protein